MNKTRIAAAIALSIGTAAAQAAVITVTRMDFYPPGATVAAHIDTLANGTVGDGLNGVGQINSGIPFFGFPWVADQQFTSTTVGAGTWSGTSASGAFTYNYSLTANMTAVGLYFDWSASVDIPVLAVFDCTNPAACTPVDTDGDGSPGTGMVTPPFPTQTPAFSGAVVPVPAAVWLFGSGLLGLVGVARRKKA